MREQSTDARTAWGVSCQRFENLTSGDQYSLLIPSFWRGRLSLPKPKGPETLDISMVT